MKFPSAHYDKITGKRPPSREPKPEAVQANIARYPSRPGRLLTTEGVRWKWQVGKRHGVILYSEDGRRLQAAAWTIKGISSGEWERAHWKKTSNAALTPFEVRQWLDEAVKWRPAP